MSRKDALALLEVIHLNQADPPTSIDPERLIHAFLSVIDRETRGQAGWHGNI